MILLSLLLALMLLAAIQAVRTERLLYAAIWLAGVSALLAIIFYFGGAPYAAVIELSVGAGLVTVLFIFAIGMAGDEPLRLTPVMPVVLIALLVITAPLLLGVLTLPLSGGLQLPEWNSTVGDVQLGAARTAESALPVVIWEERGLDVLVQVVLIFSGILGLLGLLAELKAPLQQPMAEEIAARRDEELYSLEKQVGQRERERA